MTPARSPLALSLLLALGVSTVALAEDAAALMKQAEKKHHVEQMRTEVEMILQGDGEELRRRNVEILMLDSEKEGDKVRITFLGPADVKGLQLLSIEEPGQEEEQWLYLPAFRKTRRIGGGELGDRFAGSDLAYEDFKSREVPDFRYKILRREKLEGEECYVIEAVPEAELVKKESPYGKRMIWLSVKSLVELRVRYFGRDLQPLKELTAKKFVKVKGEAMRADEVTIVDVRRKHRTVLRVEKREVEAKLAENAFSRHVLGN